jgi:cytoskeletal protein CcmA (bactofilin family)
VFRSLFASPPRKPWAPTKPAAQKPTPALAASETVLGINTHFEGDLKSEGNVRVDGAFIGDITARGRVLIGEVASVEGDIVGEAVAIGGLVRGDIVARKISVLRTGRVWGDLVSEALATEEGAFIQGQITMEERVDIAGRLPPSVEADELEEAEAASEPSLADQESPAD